MSGENCPRLSLQGATPRRRFFFERHGGGPLQWIVAFRPGELRLPMEAFGSARILHISGFLEICSLIKTALDIPDEVYRELEVRAAREGSTLAKLVTSALIAALSRPAGMPGPEKEHPFDDVDTIRRSGICCDI